MSAVKSGSSLRTLVLTPERIPGFIVPSCSPFLSLSPRRSRTSPDRTKLLSDHDDDSPVAISPKTPLSPAASPRFPFHLRPPRSTAPSRAAVSDTDVTTRAAMSLPHVGKVTTPYGFRAVLAASPCTRRRESLFHRRKPVAGTESTVLEVEHLGQQNLEGPRPSRSPGPGRPRVSLRPVKALGVHVMKELKKPAAALKARSPGDRRTETR
ncbi:C2 calcium-dependent domain-containing protein 4C-like [Mastacembelus armatus]|uniref:C2 calcium-dependent domain-containing protein 4C-like n=1 Tax=Mastacembelus armatus TaxID=205130 RepID=UPI000E4661FC|nr:C2 calcium-dependent domain-containing protein 4C-like [Mastacembelus armatus]